MQSYIHCIYQASIFSVQLHKQDASEAEFYETGVHNVAFKLCLQTYVLFLYQVHLKLWVKILRCIYECDYYV